MDALELPYPVDLAVLRPVCKLMGSDGFGRAAVGSVKDAERRDFDRPSPSIGRFSSLQIGKDVLGAIHASGSLIEDNGAATGSSRHSDLLPFLNNEDLCRKPLTGHTQFSPLPRDEVCQLQSNAGKVVRSNGKCSKRSRITREEESLSSRVTDAREVGDLSNKFLMKSTSLDRSQSGKQRNIGSKRGDKRNFKVPLKTKNDYCPVRGCSSISNLSSAGSSALGLYGLKSDIHEVTKLVDDLSLNDILEGTFKCPNLGKEKGKKAVNSNESIMQSVKKISSMLRPIKSCKSQNLPDLDNSGDTKVCGSLFNPAPLEETRVDGDCGEPSKADLCSSNEDSDRNSKMTPVHLLDVPLYSPLDLFKKLALPPTSDLDSLLLEAVTPISSSKSASDFRSGKQLLARRGGLPPFPWSHSFNGHSRMNSEAKSPVGRAICPGKWVRMKNPADLFRSPEGFTDLDSITYNQSLVPRAKIETVVLESKIDVHQSPAIPSIELGSPSAAACSLACGAPIQIRDEVGHHQQGNHLPSIIAAAQTLCEMATSLPKKSFDKEKWPKKQPSQKLMKARKLNLGTNKPEDLPNKPLGKDGHLTNSDKIWPSKKPKLSTVERCFAKAPISWATPRSSRSSSSRLVRESLPEAKLSVVNFTKPRKLMLSDWSKDGGGLQ